MDILKQAKQGVKALLKEQEDIQKWHKKENRQKNANVQHKISYAYAVLEYLYKGVNVTHKGRLSNTMINQTAHKCIEDMANADVRTFVNKVNKIAFPTYTHFLHFSAHPFRRSIEAPTTNVVKLTVDGFKENEEKFRIDTVVFKNEDYGKVFNLDVDYEGKAIAKAYDIDNNVMRTMNFDIVKGKPLSISLPKYKG